MGQTVRIRLLSADEADDFRYIRLLALRSAPEAFGASYQEEADQPLQWFADRIRSSSIFGAYEQDRIVGVAGFYRESRPKVAHKGVLWSMYVDPAAQGRGIGMALVQAILDHASSLVEQVTLTVVTDNLRAIALYERAGFERYGLEPRALKDAAGYADELLMKRLI